MKWKVEMVVASGGNLLPLCLLFSMFSLVLIGCSAGARPRITPGRIDPIFGRKTPILFAHRGGAMEVAESTRKGFRHAVRVGADVLELDVHALNADREGREREFVVWHGPELTNVRISSLHDYKESLPGERTKGENDIGAEEGTPKDDELFKILDRGVDGVMTDRPEHVRSLIDAWRKQSIQQAAHPPSHGTNR